MPTERFTTPVRAAQHLLHDAAPALHHGSHGGDEVGLIAVHGVEVGEELRPERVAGDVAAEDVGEGGEGALDGAGAAGPEVAEDEAGFEGADDWVV